MTVREGRFGPYVTDGETNASLRKGDDVESITIERAAELLADRRARGPATKKKAAKKTTAKKTAAKKAAAKKAAAKKAAAQDGRGAGHRRLTTVTAELEDAELRARALSFGSVAAEYAALRPGYPADAVAFLVGDGPRRVLDLGAGTGLLTEVLLAAGHDVVAVDPVPGDAGRAGAPACPASRRPSGRRRRSRSPTPRVDAVIAGQAAHWFDPAPAAREIRRVLRPGGTLGLIWNTRDERVPWVGALGELIAAEARGHEADQGVVDQLRPSARRRRRRPRVRDRPAGRPAEDVVAGIATRSYVALMDDARRTAFLAGVRDLLAEPSRHPRPDLLELPYVTRAYRLTPR